MTLAKKAIRAWEHNALPVNGLQGAAEVVSIITVEHAVASVYRADTRGEFRTTRSGDVDLRLNSPAAFTAHALDALDAMPQANRRGIRAAQFGFLANALLAAVKLVAGVLGNSYALVADAIESTADIFSSAIVWGGLRIASRDADEEYPWGYGKAESVAAAIVALLLCGAAVGIAIEAVREIRTPHHAPAPFTLFVLVGVVAIKETMFRRIFSVGNATGSVAVKADAWHHRSDAITSLAAFIGISVALWKGPGWEAADDWAALVAAGVIAFNGVQLLRPAIGDLMDRAPEADVFARIESAALGIPDVRTVEKLRVRRNGPQFYVDLHVQADAEMSLHDAHIVSGKVKSSIRAAVPMVASVLVHMEPYDTSSVRTSV